MISFCLPLLCVKNGFSPQNHCTNCNFWLCLGSESVQHLIAIFEYLVNSLPNKNQHLDTACMCAVLLILEGHKSDIQSQLKKLVNFIENRIQHNQFFDNTHRISRKLCVVQDRASYLSWTFHTSAAVMLLLYSVYTNQ